MDINTIFAGNTIVGVGLTLALCAFLFQKATASAPFPYRAHILQVTRLLGGLTIIAGSLWLGASWVAVLFLLWTVLDLKPDICGDTPITARYWPLVITLLGGTGYLALLQPAAESTAPAFAAGALMVLVSLREARIRPATGRKRAWMIIPLAFIPMAPYLTETASFAVLIQIAGLSIFGLYGILFLRIRQWMLAREIKASA